MSSVLILSARPDNRILTPSTIKQVFGAAAVTVLGEGWAIEVDAASIDVAEVTGKRDAAALPLDINVLPTQNRKKKLMLADMDSTIITVECVDELADFVGMKGHVSAITARAMAGELDFNQALEERVALLKGLTMSQLTQAYDERVTLTPGARTFVRTMVANGATTALVSGGFTFFTSRVKEATGFHHHQSNELEIADGALTGRIVPPILNAEAKLTALNGFLDQLGLDAADALAIGDGSNDRFMVGRAGLGIAFEAKEVLKSHAAACIDHGDLHTALILQGYTEADFVVD